MASKHKSLRCPGCTRTVGTIVRNNRCRQERDLIKLNERVWCVERESGRPYCTCECGERFPLANDTKVYLWQAWMDRISDRPTPDEPS
jgi:hypothetical protein